MKKKSKLLAMLTAVLMVFALIPAFELPVFAGESHDGWTAVNSLTKMYDAFDPYCYYVEPGNYYLTADINTDKVLAITEGEVTICLHGCSINAPADKSLPNTIEVHPGAVLNIETCGSGDGAIVNNYSTCASAIWNEGTLSISGGDIGSNRQGIHSENAKINISGGSISCGTCALWISGGQAKIHGAASIHGPENGIEAQYAKLEISGADIYSARQESAGILLESSEANIFQGDIKGVKYGINATAGSSVVFTGGTVSAADELQTGAYLRNSSLEMKQAGYDKPMLYGAIDEENSSLKITAGYFSSSPGAYISDAYKVIASGYTDFPFEVVERAKHITPAVTISPSSYTYDGKVKTPAVTVKDGSTVLEKDTDYTVSYPSGRKNAGKYTVKVTLKYNYAGSASAQFTIKKAANPLKIKAKTATVKYSKVKNKDQKLAVTKVIGFTKKGQGAMKYTKVSGNKKITVNKKSGKVTVKKGIKKGTYKVKVKVKAAGNKNYKASAVKTVTFRIKVK